MVITAESDELYQFWPSLCLPLVIFSFGIFVCLITSFFASHIAPPTSKENVESVLKLQLLISTILMTPMSFIACWFFLPSEAFTINTTTDVYNWHIWLSVIFGLWTGLAIGYITEYYTGNGNRPVRELAESTESGAATNIIYGLALGYTSTIIPIICIAITIYASWSLGDMLGIAYAAIGILSTMAIALTIDAFGPICDNAGGIAEMSGMGREVREQTDGLDAAGNTTAAIGKGFAIGSAAMVSLALWGAYVSTADLTFVDLLSPFVYAGLVFGAMLPYWFSGMTMKSVGEAAKAMVLEVRDQFEGDNAIPGLQQYLKDVDELERLKEKHEHKELDKKEDLDRLEQLREHLDELERTNAIPRPNYGKCVAISTKASLREMIAPGCLVLFTPLIIGYLFGIKCLAGMLVGVLSSGVQMAISMSNTGGAWDNAKKYIEAGRLTVKGVQQKKKSDCHKAAVVGDTVGDPLKDTSGPALNILVKLSAITSLVFVNTFPSTGYLVQAFQ
jgi:inorganic pyrophosphatase